MTTAADDERGADRLYFAGTGSALRLVSRAVGQSNGSVMVTSAVASGGDD